MRSGQMRFTAPQSDQSAEAARVRGDEAALRGSIGCGGIARHFGQMLRQ